jgi:hypothetical protein
MMERRRKRVHVALAAALLAGTLLPRIALCISPDGHRAFEILGATCCRPATSHPGSLERSCAAGCVDTPLGISAVFHSREKAFSGPSVFHGWSPTVAPAAVRHGDPCASITAAPGRPGPGSALLRSGVIVLRC